MSFIVEVHETERHLHHREISIGAAAAPSGTHFADEDVFTCFQSTAGNVDYGPWLQVLGTGDTPFDGGMVKFDFNKFLICDVAALADQEVHRIQIGVGASGAQVVWTGFEFIPLRGGVAVPLWFGCDKITTGSEVWLRHACENQNGTTMDFKAALHELPSYASEVSMDTDFETAIALILANPTTFKNAFEKLTNFQKSGIDFSNIFD